MKYALLVYITAESVEGLSSEDERSLHRGHQAGASASASLIAHYRLRPPERTTTVRVDGGRVVKTEGPIMETNKGLRALYLLESNEPEAVLDFASRHPAIRFGGTVEVWPLIEHGRHDRQRHRPIKRH